MNQTNYYESDELKADAQREGFHTMTSPDGTLSVSCDSFVPGQLPPVNIV
jgi:hypothetical protein